MYSCMSSPAVTGVGSLLLFGLIHRWDKIARKTKDTINQTKATSARSEQLLTQRDSAICHHCNNNWAKITERSRLSDECFIEARRGGELGTQFRTSKPHRRGLTYT